MKAGDRVKIIDGALKGAVGEVVGISEDEGTALVYVSGIINGIEVNATESIDLNALESC